MFFFVRVFFLLIEWLLSKKLLHANMWAKYSSSVVEEAGKPIKSSATHPSSTCDMSSDGKEDLHETNSRDAFTVALLKHAARNLGVQYMGDAVETSENIVMDKLGRIKAEIRSRERLLGVENMGLIPLFIEAGDLSLTCEDSLMYYKKALGIVEANKDIKRDSTMMNDVGVSSFADLGSRFFRYGQYQMAERLFTIAAAICRDKVTGVAEGISFSTAQCGGQKSLQRLKGHLLDWKKTAEAAQEDLSTLFSNASRNTQRFPDMRDAYSQTDLAEHSVAMPASQLMGTKRKMKELKETRNGEELKRLVEYVFDPMTVEDGFTRQLLPKGSKKTTRLHSEHITGSNPCLALRESIDCITSRISAKADSINSSSGALRRELQTR
ncbi:hypothetical protein MOQ_002078 [Trypanosoma cruzi marinkellei]|uniref:BRO1 domain-containing protein n=1 Tax=Trypanosoma cruzi marinkellei TaxID=85056 RepID=K2MR08_TRYCR|nr:hypothetical protein MOQ_002078 [Trypanosoma cruzi marinkellei]